MALLGSVLLAVVGLYIGLSSGGTEMGTVGWVFFAFGVVFVAGNLFLRSRGIRSPRDWRGGQRRP